MSSKKNLIWLASYPKSGNTWVRILLSNYLNDSDEAININEIDSSVISSSRAIFDENIPFLSSDLYHEEIDELRSSVYQSISDENENYVYIKTHDALTHTQSGKEIFPTESTRAVIHIVRNPLDVAISYANHSNIKINKSIKSLNNKTLNLSAKAKGLNPQLRQKLLSWSDHYYSWKNTKSPYLLIKYEDLIENTEKEFKRIISFIYGEVNEEKLKKAVSFSSFNQLKKQEKETSFRERPVNSKMFFRKGKSGAWKDELTPPQIKAIESAHSKVMQELSYSSN